MDVTEGSADPSHPSGGLVATAELFHDVCSVHVLRWFGFPVGINGPFRVSEANCMNFKVQFVPVKSRHVFTDGMYLCHRSHQFTGFWCLRVHAQHVSLAGHCAQTVDNSFSTCSPETRARAAALRCFGWFRMCFPSSRSASTSKNCSLVPFKHVLFPVVRVLSSRRQTNVSKLFATPCQVPTQSFTIPSNTHCGPVGHFIWRARKSAW